MNIALVNGSLKMVLLLKWAIDMSNNCKSMGLTEEKLSQRCGCLKEKIGTGISMKSILASFEKNADLLSKKEGRISMASRKI